MTIDDDTAGSSTNHLKIAGRADTLFSGPTPPPSSTATGGHLSRAVNKGLSGRRCN